MRPADVQRYALGEPGWFATEGWSLTPETAGMARLMGQGPHLAPIHASRAAPAAAAPAARRRPAPGRRRDPAVTFTVAIDGRDLDSWEAAPVPGFFVRSVAMPAGALGGDGRGRRPHRDGHPGRGDVPVARAIEQFDLQSPGVTMWAFGRGLYEPELDNQRGRAWRWMSERAVIEIPQTAGDVTLVLEGESPLTSFDGPSTLEVWSGDRQLARVALTGDFTVRIALVPNGWPPATAA